MSTSRFHKGWAIALAGLGINLTLGVMYSWSIIGRALLEQGWTVTQTQIPYMAACVAFAFSMVPGGKLQDKLGPKPVIMISAVLAAIGYFFSGIFMSVIGLTIFYGLTFGFAMGLGYAATTPAAVKWFNPKQRGVISGIVVSGFGLAPIYIAPVTNYLISNFGIEKTFFYMSAWFFVVLFILVQFISNPPEGYIAPGQEANVVRKTSVKDYEWREVLGTKQFYLLWTMFCFGTFAGLLITGQLANIGLEQAGLTNSFILIAVYAVANFSGRIGCGIIADKIGKMRALFLTFVAQIAVFIVFSQLTTPATLIFGTFVVGFMFGGTAAIFPSITMDYYGMKNIGLNYGMLITAWGIGGVFGPLLGGQVRDLTGGYHISYMTSAVLCIFGAILCLITKSPNEASEADTEEVPSPVVAQG